MAKTVAVRELSIHHNPDGYIVRLRTADDEHRILTGGWATHDIVRHGEVVGKDYVGDGDVEG